MKDIPGIRWGDRFFAKPSEEDEDEFYRRFYRSKTNLKGVKSFALGHHLLKNHNDEILDRAEDLSRECMAELNRLFQIILQYKGTHAGVDRGTIVFLKITDDDYTLNSARYYEVMSAKPSKHFKYLLGLYTRRSDLWRRYHKLKSIQFEILSSFAEKCATIRYQEVVFRHQSRYTYVFDRKQLLQEVIV